MVEAPKSPSPDPIDPNSDIQGKPSVQPDRSGFQKHMRPNANPAQTSSPAQATPMDLAKKPGPSSTPTVASLTSQANSIDANFKTLSTQLQSLPSNKLKKQHETLLDEKLRQANKHIQSAAEKMGLPPGKVPSDLAKMGPIKRFLGYVTNGQKQILEAKKKLETLKTEKQLNPSDLILVQIKLSQAQQELEYSSILVAKVVDMLKQLMNIQI